MKKTTLLSLILTVCIGYSAQSQDTLRLFGSQKKEQPKQEIINPNLIELEDGRTLMVVKRLEY